ncbi:MAG: spore germination protein, partial [Firmicutes bacterium]|nr:spore germination protein [Bacillota bacterium]
NNLAVALPGLYIALAVYHPELLPTNLAMAIASFTGPNYSVGIAWRILKFLVTIGAAVFGLYGLTIAGMVILIHAADLKSFGVSYLAPWAPLQWRELGDAPVRKPFWARWHRLETYCYLHLYVIYLWHDRNFRP